MPRRCLLPFFVPAGGQAVRSRKANGHGSAPREQLKSEARGDQMENEDGTLWGFGSNSVEMQDSLAAALWYKVALDERRHTIEDLGHA